MEAIESLQKAKGWPATNLELSQHTMKNKEKFPFNPQQGGMLSILYQNDKIFRDSTGSYVSLEKWNEDFKTMNERINEQWTPLGYKHDDKLRITPGPDAKTVDFEQLWDCLNSQDESKL